MSILNSPWMNDELRILHDSVLRFTQDTFEPHREAWEKQGMCDRDAWRQAGEAGLLCASIPEAYGGAGGHRGAHGAAGAQSSRTTGPRYDAHQNAIAVGLGGDLRREGDGEQRRDTWDPVWLSGSDEDEAPGEELA